MNGGRKWMISEGESWMMKKLKGKWPKDGEGKEDEKEYRK